MGKRNELKSIARPGVVSRREFLALAAAALTGCRAAQQSTTPPPHTPTFTPIQTPAPTLTPTPAATATPTVAPRRPDLIQVYPGAPSTVVHTHHAGAWSDDALVPDALCQMLDASITELTGLQDARESWAALFAPHERVAIKVSTIDYSRYWTHPPLVMAVTERLQEAGVPAEQIVIFDRFGRELQRAGYTINQDGPGVRCYGTDLKYVAGWALGGREIGLSEILLNCDALINMPILKENSTGGITFAMKNHYGTFDKPQDFHPPRFDQAVVELNAQPAIWDRTRLIIGDALHIAYGDMTGWSRAEIGDSIVMSFDPIAHDAVGLQVLCDAFGPEGSDAETARRLAAPWFALAVEAGLGTDDPAHMELVELTLG